MSTTAYIGLGSNLGDSVSNLHSALQDLDNHPHIKLLKTSNFYASKPHGPQNQPDYVNAVAALSTTLPALALLSSMQAIENAHGRKRLIRWGARTLDLDLLLFGDNVINEPDLIVPHPCLCERSFVVWPLMELAPELQLPQGQSLRACRDQLAGDDLWVIS